MDSKRRDLNELVGKAQRQAVRTAKHLWQRMNLDKNAKKTPLFVLGNQRSGTTMLMKVLEKSRYMRVYQEHSRKAFGTDWRLLPKPVIQELIKESYAASVVFKPLCDAHLALQLLSDYPNAKAIWIYRHYDDVANSAVNKWGEHLKDVMRQITVGDWDALGWRGENLSQENITLVKQLYSPEMNFQEPAALMWYLRNQWYFALGLDQDPRVLLVRYESLVQNPEAGMKRIFKFAESTYEPEIIEDVSERSVGKGKDVQIRPAVQELCDALLGQLDLCYEAMIKQGK
jgi:hypothetical protein